MEAVSIVFGCCIDVCSMAAKKLDNIVKSLIAGKVEWAPVI
jgi:hypothetical protein